ncbi:hypothetical protein BpHYR1_004337 [Brachionus plicatilis]|uniref:Uncharacterized protein n=1 Tax=Brachionus plicatilis TaxID=10195 RepID=A0A3M7SDR9_BRAPC|nr:hypothetical protein BpHYR1_004337 [Brachionus plicatilis]
MEKFVFWGLYDFDLLELALEPHLNAAQASTSIHLCKVGLICNDHSFILFIITSQNFVNF